MESSLLTEHTSDGQAVLYTHLMFPMKNRMKTMTVKINPGTQVNTIPLSRYQKIFSHKVDLAKYPKQGALIPTKYSWIFHNGKTQPFLGHFITDFSHASQPRSYPMQFYVFKDAICQHILLSYTRLEHLGILELKVPNLAAKSHIDTITSPNPYPSWLEKDCKTHHLPGSLSHPAKLHMPSPWQSTPSSMKKTTKTVWFRNPISDSMPQRPSPSVCKQPKSALKPTKAKPCKPSTASSKQPK